ncbi:FAD-dependent oxidoreductase [Streptosporangium sp. NPDC005286]|uniref:NAD(P)/FAD-dependent oxidoreductase n=1 Tax=Streptosporangium sp. NPDC005286 TaxID=3154463 RepID=UPI0033B4E495
MLGDGGRVPFDGLIVATGVEPRRLPFGHDLAGVHLLRDDRDVMALRAAFEAGPRLVIVGAGFLGAEVAATARGLGPEVTLVDPLPAPMLRQLGATLAGRVTELHRAQGVRLRMGTGVLGITGERGRVTAVALDDGTVEPADCVLVAADPRRTWPGCAPRACRWPTGSSAPPTAAPPPACTPPATSHPGLHPRYGRMRLEHRMNATEQGIAAARNLLDGDVAVFAPMPYSWTDQYETKIQIHGVIPSHAELVVAEGDLDGDRFTVLYRAGSRTHAVLTWNDPKSARRYRQELAAGDPPTSRRRRP